jgi:tRNA-2-methylthio-N6-dimethylallyladenosine synthase
MNVYDSTRMVELFKSIGYGITATAVNADIVVLNGCIIREKAVAKVYSDLGRIQKIHRKAEHTAIIIFAGCVGQAEGQEALKNGAHIVIGPRSYHKLPGLLEDFNRKGVPISELCVATNEKFEEVPAVNTLQRASVFLTIQEGCNKFCRFCIVPYTRGREFSRPVAKIYQEACRLVANGARELVLLGQNVNAYCGQDEDGQPARLAQLIKRISRIEGIKRIRYTTSHPIDMTDDLISAHGEIEQLMPHVHLPVQSGSDRILKNMNRYHTIAHYHKVVAALKNARPDICLSTDIIIGYPDETDEDFAATLTLLDQVRFAQVYSFKYSPRKKTPAAHMKQLPEHIKDERLQTLQQVTERHQREFNSSFLNKQLEVLVDKHGKYKNQAVGFSQYMQPVALEDATHLFGQVVLVKINEVSSHTLKGDLIFNA